MKRKWIALVVAAIAAFSMLGTGLAEILPPAGEGQIGLGALVVCEGVTLRKNPDDASAEVTGLVFGGHVIVMTQKDGWAQCTLSDSVDEDRIGWLKADTLLIDPFWYFTAEEGTPVYAWNDADAPRIAFFADRTLLPILKDAGEWLVVSVNGATGWILKTAADVVPAE